MKQLNYIFLIAICSLAFTHRSNLYEDNCGVRNNTFIAGEEVTFHVYYTLAGVYVNAGTATFTNSLERLNGRSVYHVVGDGKTNPSYEWFYKVRDRYETFIDTATLQPLKFVRNIQEGGYNHYENITFNQTANTAVTNEGVFKTPDCIQDVISAIYYARNIDFEVLQPGDRIPFNLFIDNQVYNMYIRYMGKETVKTKYGKFRAHKFKPLTIKGNVFEGGEKMTVWVSDDENHLVLRAESPIAVGSVKMDMMDYKNLRYPLTSLIKR
jgi:hypothetical protein